MVRLGDLGAFVVRAKVSTYVGSGTTAESSRLGSHDLAFQSDEWLYRDSYFGGTDFLGQETVWFRAEPVWAENYYGYILRPDLIDAARAGATIKEALSALYQQGRFLGGFDWAGPHGHYQDHSSGDVSHRTTPQQFRSRKKGQAPTGTTVAQEPEPRLETVKQLPEPDGQA